MRLGDKQFPNILIQGPLAGVSCAPFRALTWRYSRPAFSCTEMISCKTLLHQSKLAQRRFITKDIDEGPVCFQLSGNDPAELALAAKQVTDYGADLIDLNCGCPMKKIRSKGTGSRLLSDPLKLFQLVSALKRNTHVPVSIKIRVDGGSTDKFNQQIAKVVTEAGADYLVVHGRHWTEQYDTPCHYEDIKFFVDAVKIPVIGNGDIACIASLHAMLNTGCSGVMISRAGVGQPWLIAKLQAALSQQSFITPSFFEVGTIFLEHVLRLNQLLNSEKFAILQARKFAKYYARDLPDRSGFVAAVNVCDSFDNLTLICKEYFGGN